MKDDYETITVAGRRGPVCIRHSMYESASTAEEQRVPARSTRA